MGLINVNNLLKNYNSTFGSTRKEIAVVESYEEYLWPVEIDQCRRSLIDQFLMNIYRNAWSAMPAGGKLVIQTANKKLNRNDALRFEATPGNYVKITITDMGTGMDKKTQQKILEPFLTCSEKNFKTVPGMSSALEIIKNNGCFIILSGVPGKGTAFDIYLPAFTRRQLDKSPTDPVAIHDAGTILMIDDEQTILDVVKKLINRIGYDSITANGGNEGIKKYTECRDKIVLVILDIMMPGMSGDDTYAALKQINKDIKVLFASGFDLDDDIKKLIAGGCNGFIQKPFGANQLSYKINEILNQ